MQYYRYKSGGNLITLDGKTYAGVQPANQKSIKVTHNLNRFGYQITLEQTGGVNRDYDWEHYYDG